MVPDERANRVGCIPGEFSAMPTYIVSVRQDRNQRQQYTFRSGAMLNLHRRDWTDRAKKLGFLGVFGLLADSADEDLASFLCEKLNVVFGFCPGGQKLHGLFHPCQYLRGLLVREILGNLLANKLLKPCRQKTADDTK
jgi:hypothetical protein